MIRLVFIGNDKKFFTILKMSIPNLRISITQFDNKCIDFIEEERADIVLLDMDSKNERRASAPSFFLLHIFKTVSMAW